MNKYNIDLQDLLEGGGKLNSQRTNYICNCPFCSKDKHFYINVNTLSWDCKKCGESGNIYKLLKHLNKTYLLGGKTIELTESLKSIRTILEEEIDKEVKLLELPKRKLPAGWKQYKESAYLKGRNLTKEDFKRYNLGYTTLLSKYKDYVIIPVYDEGEVRGFVARYGNKKVPENKLRYNNSVGTDFGKLLFGFDEIVKNKTVTVILVEGIFDKIKVDKVLRLWDDDEVKCNCTFGKKISEYQITKLKSKGVYNVVLLYDFDALKDIKKYGFVLENYFSTTITYTSGKKDIDECSDEEALSVFDKLQRPKEFSDNTISKLKR